MELNEIIKYAKLLETEKKHLNKVSLKSANDLNESRAVKTTNYARLQRSAEYFNKIESKLFEIMEQTIKDNVITFKYLDDKNKAVD